MLRSSLAAEFKSVADQILKKLQHLTFIGLDGRQIFDFDPAACFFDRYFENDPPPPALF